MSYSGAEGSRCVRCGADDWYRYARSRACGPCMVARNKRARHADPARRMWYQAKERAKRRGLPFDIGPEDVVLPAACPVLGVPLEVNKGGSCGGPNSPSLDRIDPAKGYTKGNVRVISWRANDLKRDATAAELRAVLSYLEATERI